MTVGQALRFNMPWLVEIALDEAFAAAEGGDCLPCRRLEELWYFIHLASDLQPSTAAAERSLDRNRQPVLGREGDDCISISYRVRRARHQWSAYLPSDVSGPDLIAKSLDGSRRRADPDQSRSKHCLGKRRILGKKAVPRVNSIGAAASGDLENLGNVEVSLRRGSAAQRVRLIRECDEQGVEVRVCIYCDAGKSGIGGRTYHPNGAPPSVRDNHPAY